MDQDKEDHPVFILVAAGILTALMVLAVEVDDSVYNLFWYCR